MNFRQLDLNLLRVLAAIHRSGSVTAAGRALALSQPATSNALSRLRDHFRDDLFVRSPSGLKPTRLCERIAPEVQAQLQLLEATLTERDDFDPAHSEMRWRTSLSDLGEMMFLPPLAAALREQAPHARLFNVSVNSRGVGVAVGAFGALLRTVDGGVSWQPIERDWKSVFRDGDMRLGDFFMPSLYGVQVNEDNRVWVVGELALAMRSPDGGETWQITHAGGNDSEGVEPTLSAVHVRSDGTGFAVGQEGYVLKTRVAQFEAGHDFMRKLVTRLQG